MDAAVARQVRLLKEAAELADGLNERSSAHELGVVGRKFEIAGKTAVCQVEELAIQRSKEQ